MILYIEDDLDSALLVSTYLKMHNHKVVHVNNGKEALDWIAKNGDPILILLDLNMPVMNGYEFMNAYNKAPVVIYSAAADDITFPYEPVGKLSKPCSADEIINIIERIKQTQRPNPRKWHYLLPCTHKAINVGMSDDMLTLTCMVPNCNKKTCKALNEIPPEIVIELALDTIQDTYNRAAGVQLT